MHENGGEPERLAPVIPLFGGNASVPEADGPTERPDAEHVVPRRTGESGLWRSTWDAAETTDSGTPSDRHPARGGADRAAPRLRALRADGGADGEETGAPDPERLREAAEDLLVRKLRSKSLSVSEARLVLRGFEADGHRLDGAQIDDIIDDYCARAYLDDTTLAWHLVTSGVERKGQGRVALSRSLAQRGIPRDVIEEALAELPDDDADRALEFARSKARSMSKLDEDTALRRLVGQLSRRGYNGSVAMKAAKAALAEVSGGGPIRGVRFVDSD